MGQLNKRLRKKIRLAYKNALAAYLKNPQIGIEPIKPKSIFEKCKLCEGSGLIKTQTAPVADTENYPHISIIGAGIGGVALGVACLHRGIPFTIYEKDLHFSSRSQGYGLTLQQASKALKSFGILSLEESVVSTRHLVHNTVGKVIAEWGMRKWQEERLKKPLRHTNIHISRQSLRKVLLEELHGEKENIIADNKLSLRLDNKNSSYLINYFNHIYLLNKVDNKLLITNLKNKKTILLKNNSFFKLFNINFYLTLYCCVIMPITNKTIFTRIIR